MLPVGSQDRTGAEHATFGNTSAAFFLYLHHCRSAPSDVRTSIGLMPSVNAVNALELLCGVLITLIRRVSL